MCLIPSFRLSIRLIVHRLAIYRFVAQLLSEGQRELNAMLGVFWNCLRNVLDLWKQQGPVNKPRYSRIGLRSPELLEPRRMLAANPIVFNAALSQIVIAGTSAADAGALGERTSNGM